MDVGVGLPMTALSRQDLTSFVAKVESGPFSSVSLGQRLTFDSNDPLIALTFVAAVTTRIRLLTSVLCLPYHKVGVTAQQAATLDRLSEGRFSFIFTPKHGSWLNLVEGFFSKLARSALRHIRVASHQELKDRIMAAINDINRDPVVHRWTYGLAETVNPI